MRVKRLSLRAVVVVMAGTVAIGLASSPTQAARAEHAGRDAFLRTTPRRGATTAAFASGYLVPEASVERTGGTFRLRIHNRLALGMAAARLMWFVDTRDQSYQIFILNDPEVDAGYIYDYLRAKGVEISPERIRTHLIGARDRSVAARLRSRSERPVSIPQTSRHSSRPQSQNGLSFAVVESPDGSTFAPPDLEAGRDFSCDGTIYSEVLVEDPIGINLARTKLLVSIIGNDYSTVGTIQQTDEPCWSNSITILLTIWSTVFCGSQDFTSGTDYYAYRVGIYQNDNFPPCCPQFWDQTTVGTATYAGWDPFGEGVWTDYVFETDGSWGGLLEGTPDSSNSVMCWY